MRIGFVGCGAIGSCYASYLLQKHEVCVLDTYEPVIEAIKKNGILLDKCAPGYGNGETEAYHPTIATTDPKEIGVVDLLVVKVESRRPYLTSYESFDIHQIANVERKVPLEWIINEGTYVSDEFIEYARPLIMGEIEPYYSEGVPQHLSLQE